REEREDADAAAPGRRRRDRSDRAEPAVLPWPEALRRRERPGPLSARAARPARGEAPAGPAEPDPGVVRQVPRAGDGRHGTAALMDSLFQVLVENSTDAVVMLNDDGTVRFASESSARLLGYTLDERLGRSAFEMLHPDDIGAAREAFHECLERPGVP